MLLIAGLLAGCNANKTPAGAPGNDTLKYAYKATYSSDITVPGNPVNAQKVLQVWKMFETANIQAMTPYFADSVKYDDAAVCTFTDQQQNCLPSRNRTSAGSTPCGLTL